MDDIQIWLDQEPGTVPGADEAVEELAAALRVKGLSVEVTVGRIPVLRGLTIFEEILIFIGSGVSTALLNSVVTDVYNEAKEWGRKRFGAKSRPDNPPRQEFKIIGPDGEEIITWWIDGKGEHKIETRAMFDVWLYSAGDNKAQVINELYALFDADITQVEHAVEHSPFCLLRRVDLETADRVKTILENAGASVVRSNRSFE